MRDNIMQYSDPPIVISFPAASTLEIVHTTLVHAHPEKRGYPSVVPEYIMLRGKGGLVKYLYQVKGCYTFDANDYTDGTLPIEWEKRLMQYTALRKAAFGFDSAPNFAYRFYFLEVKKEFDPPLKIQPNTQSFRYHDFETL